MSLADLLTNALFGSGLAFAAAVQPGPLQAFLVSRVVATGWKRTLPACFAPVLSDGPIAALAILVLGRLRPGAVDVLRACGGLLLLYLAASAFRQWRRPGAPPPASAPRTLIEAAAINLLNPNPYLAWAFVLGPAAVAAWGHHPIHAVAFVVAFYVTMIVALSVFVFLAGTARFLDAGRQHALVGVSALLLASIGAILLAVGVRGAWGYLAGGGG